jgi:hypothetical protein
MLKGLQALAAAQGLSWEDVVAEAAARGTKVAASTSGHSLNMSTKSADIARDVTGQAL